MPRSNLLARARRAPNGWTYRDLVRLLLGAGFVATEQSNHTVFRHPDYPDLQISVPRHRDIKAYLVRDALAIIDEAQKRKRDNHGSD